jgi:predicted dehydrogenase
MYADCEVFSSYQDALENTRSGVDVAFIGVHPHVHGSPVPPHDMELQLLKAGVHVFVEKPVSLQSPDKFLPYVNTVEEARKEKGLVVSVGYMFRYHPAVIKMKAVLAEYGRPVVGLSARYQCAYSTLDRPLWWNMDTSGGPIIEQATHFCDLMRYLGGEVRSESVIGHSVPYSSDPTSVGYLSAVPENISEESLMPHQRIPRFTTAQWSFESGGLGSLVHGAVLQGCRYEASLDVWADGLRMALEDPYSEKCTLRIRRGKTDDEEVFTFPDADPYLAEDKAFLTAVTTRDPSHVLCSYSDAAKTYSLTCAISTASSC